MFKYHFKYSVVETTQELTDEQISKLKGIDVKPRTPLYSLLSELGLPQKRNLFINHEELFFCHYTGLIKADDWDKVLPKSFLDFQSTITEFCAINDIPRSLDRFFKTHSKSYNQHITSVNYQHLLGKLRHIGSSYGELVNKKKTNNTRQIDRSVKSKERALKLLSDNHVSLAEPWHPVREGKTLLRFKVKCNICSTEYETYLHTTSVNRCPNCMESRYTSHREALFKSFISKYTKVLQSVRYKISPYEIDLFLPETNLGFEFNGFYYHSNLFHDKFYHSLKTSKALENGVKLYHIWEDVPDYKVKSFILNKLGLSKRIYARNTTIGNGTVGFHNLSHFSNDCQASHRFSLFYNGKEVAQMSFRRCSEGIEIARYSCYPGVCVVGGFSKLLKYAMKLFQGYFTKVVSYCDRDLTPDYRDSIYYKSGFNFIVNSPNIMRYFITKPIVIDGTQYLSNTIVPRQVCQKHKILRSVKGLDPSLSEEELCKSLGIYQVHNSGNFKFYKNLL